MKNFILIFALLLSISINANNKEKDFISIYVEELNGGKDCNPDDYKCIIISPSMISQLMQMPNINDTDKSQEIQKILPNIKSVQVFIAAKNISNYQKVANNLFDMHNSTYQPIFASTDDFSIKVRKNQNKIIELILLHTEKSTEQKNFIIIDITGNLTDDVIESLIKLKM
ncbi:MAG: DUF4252 domain-containing protein [Prevotellaceae bacterium]|nr:DUF4252 domain-containing protein [Candidatus Faecinaster equi]